MSEVIINKDYVHCKNCGKLTERTKVGKFESGRNNKYHDSKGKLWNGRCCPSCNNKRAKSTMSQLREIRKAFQSAT